MVMIIVIIIFLLVSRRFTRGACIQSVTGKPDGLNNFCSNQYLKFFFLYLIDSHFHYTYNLKKNKI